LSASPIHCFTWWNTRKIWKCAAFDVESMVWNVLSLALNAEGIHVATCLHAKIRTLIQTNSWCLMLIFERYNRPSSIFCFHIVSLTDPLFHLMKHSQNMKVCSVWRRKQKRCHQLSRNNSSASCPCYAAFRIVVQSFNNSPRFVLNSRVAHTLEQMWMYNFFDVGSKNDAINYRGITVLPVISMIVEAVIRDRIQPLIHNMQNQTQRVYERIVPHECCSTCRRSIQNILMIPYLNE
jgi:hypothetical protein